MTKRDDFQRRYESAAHAVQAGVGMELADDERYHNTNSSASPKQLRTGINMAMIEHYRRKILRLNQRPARPLKASAPAI